MHLDIWGQNVNQIRLLPPLLQFPLFWQRRWICVVINHAWRMCPCLQDDTALLCRDGKIEQHHPSTGRPVPAACLCLWCWKSKHAEERQGVFLVNDEIIDGLCKMSYHRFVGPAILLLGNVFHRANCVDNRIIKDIPCVMRKELVDVISKWVPISLITWTRSIAECLLGS